VRLLANAIWTGVCFLFADEWHLMFGASSPAAFPSDGRQRIKAFGNHRLRRGSAAERVT
jgi:hypothetical protein